LVPAKLEELSQIYKTKEFKNREGEGIVSRVVNEVTGEEMQVLIGNDRLAKSFDIDVNEEIRKNILLLE
jgi:hypothetical protein